MDDPKDIGPLFTGAGPAPLPQDAYGPTIGPGYPVTGRTPAERTGFEWMDFGQKYALPPNDYGPPDLWPSSTNRAGYPVYQETRGRFLAGLGEIHGVNGDVMQANNMNADGIKDYANELDMLAAADDVVGNGVFDPPGTTGPVYPDQAIFASHFSLPGYIVRDRFYAPSEVIDITTGEPVMYVPAGAVSIDYAQRQAFENTMLWTLPPAVNPWPMNEAMPIDTVVPREGAWPIGQTDTERKPASAGQLFVWAGLAGLSVGLLVFLVTKKRK